jgi:radical SAM protein with 4Fe4S-binding SPASM domain
MIELFKGLEIETISYCPKKCPTCIRNSDKSEEMKDWHSTIYLPMNLIDKVYKEAKELGYNGAIGLSHYNEPMLDYRLPEIIRMGMSYGFTQFSVCTAESSITEEIALSLQGLLCSMRVSITNDNQQARILALFPTTEISFCSTHILTHYSPYKELQQVIEERSNEPCYINDSLLIINHKGDLVLCCEEAYSHNDFGNIADKTIEELWFGEKHLAMVEALKKQGSRKNYPYCSTCPR